LSLKRSVKCWISKAKVKLRRRAIQTKCQLGGKHTFTLQNGLTASITRFNNVKDEKINKLYTSAFISRLDILAVLFRHKEKLYLIKFDLETPIYGIAYYEYLDCIIRDLLSDHPEKCLEDCSGIFAAESWFLRGKSNYAPFMWAVRNNTKPELAMLIFPKEEKQ